MNTHQYAEALRTAHNDCRVCRGRGAIVNRDAVYDCATCNGTGARTIHTTFTIVHRTTGRVVASKFDTYTHADDYRRTLPVPDRYRIFAGL